MLIHMVNYRPRSSNALKEKCLSKDGIAVGGVVLAVSAMSSDWKQRSPCNLNNQSLECYCQTVAAPQGGPGGPVPPLLKTCPPPSPS